MKIITYPLLVLVFFGLLSSCSSTVDKGESPSKVDAPLVEDKYRLLKDREAFEEIRKQVPADKKIENDELAFILQWMNEEKRPPSEVREKFNTAARKKRDLFQKDMKKIREAYVKQERKDREAFTKEQAKVRKDFVGNKPSREERKEFFDELDSKRKDFHTQQREKRDEFEADMRDKRKNFEDYMHEMTAQFNQEHRAYSKRYEEAKKQKAVDSEM